jgi:hypothetical protein
VIGNSEYRHLPNATANSGSGFLMLSACAKPGVLSMTRSLAVE